MRPFDELPDPARALPGGLDEMLATAGRSTADVRAELERRSAAGRPAGERGRAPPRRAGARAVPGAWRGHLDTLPGSWRCAADRQELDLDVDREPTPWAGHSPGATA